MKSLAEQLRKFAEDLRKQGGSEVKPTPIPNPVASRARGDLGSLDAGPKSSGEGNKFVPKLPKFGVGGAKWTAS
jgi:hypothetical protein